MIIQADRGQVLQSTVGKGVICRTCFFLYGLLTVRWLCGKASGAGRHKSDQSRTRMHIKHSTARTAPRSATVLRVTHHACQETQGTHCWLLCVVCQPDQAAWSRGFLFTPCMNACELFNSHSTDQSHTSHWRAESAP